MFSNYCFREIAFSDVSKHKVVYIAGYLAHKIALELEGDTISAEFID